MNISFEEIPENSVEISEDRKDILYGVEVCGYDTYKIFPICRFFKHYLIAEENEKWIKFVKKNSGIDIDSFGEEYETFEGYFLFKTLDDMLDSLIVKWDKNIKRVNDDKLQQMNLIKEKLQDNGIFEQFEKYFNKS
jgi:hypothetical protein